MKVVFLDFDGVINIPMWDIKGEIYRYNSPSDGKVNDFQAICWLNQLCIKSNANIVLTTSWRNTRTQEFLAKLLYDSGLNPKIKVIGKTPRIDLSSTDKRSFEIFQYLEDNVEIKKFVILDDKKICGCLQKFWVKCNSNYGFKEPEFKKALNILNASSQN